MSKPPSMELEEVTSNECVKTLESLVKQITPHYKRFDRYVFELTDERTAKELINDPRRKANMINEITIAINTATEINYKVQGLYGRVRDVVNEAINKGTDEVTINATDEQYGGCTVSTKHAQDILNEMLDQKNDAETMIGFMYQSYNDILVPKFPDEFKKKSRPYNRHCVRDMSYIARKHAYETVLEPMTKKLSKLRGENESRWHFKLRKWLQKDNKAYTADTLQTFVDAVYDATLSGDSIESGIIKDNCYKALTQEEYKWVIREVDVRKKKNEIDVYMIDNQPDRCKTILSLLFRILFAYDKKNDDTVASYIQDTIDIINGLDIHMMKILVAIPETCIFTFPTDEASEYIHTVTLETVKHCIGYNQNWEVDAAYMYWFWTHLQGEGYHETVDPEGNKKDVPASAKQGIDYFTRVFKPKLSMIARKMISKLIGNEGIYNNRSSAEILAPWIVKIFEKEFHDPALRDSILKNKIAEVDGMNVRRFINWAQSTILHDIPKYVWKSFNALSEEKRLQRVPIQFLPNNFTLFDKEYELETAVLTTLNSIYWLYGYISSPDGTPSTTKPLITAFRKYIYQGGLCYELGKNPVTFNVAEYEPFVVQWNPKYAGEPYVPMRTPDVDTNQAEINGEWLFKWTTAPFSFITQGITSNIRPINVDDRIAYIGARCLHLPYDIYIIDQLVKRYKETPGCPYSTNDTVLQNQWLFTSADHIAGKYINGVDTLVNILFNGTVRRLMRCSFTIPYNNIISTNFINAAHFGWAGKSVPTNSRDSAWNDVLLPQYIFNKSTNDESDEPKFDKKDTETYTTVTCDVVKLNDYVPIDMTFYICDVGQSMLSGTSISC